MMDLSVIVPAHNTAQWIPELIDSLKRQQTTYKVEYIFICDACTDDTEKIIRNSGLMNYTIKCNFKSCGLTRNVGLMLAEGEYVWFMDSDDYLLKDTAIQEAMDFARGKELIRIPFTSDNYKIQCYAMVWQYLFKRSLIGGLRFRKEQPAEDNAFMDEIFKRVDKNRIPVFREPLYFYRYLRPGSNMERYTKGEKI